MRIIKFRAWDSKFNFMLEPREVIVQGDGKNSTPDIILMQFTGLIDKNGADIYEGDILKPNNQKTRIRVVKWRVGNNSCGFNLSNADFRNREIIGNIYQNPELVQK